MPSKIEKIANEKTYIGNFLPELYYQIPTDGIKSKFSYSISNFFHISNFLVVIFIFTDTCKKQKQRKTKSNYTFLH